MAVKNANRFGAGLKLLVILAVLAGIVFVAWTRLFVTDARVRTVLADTAVDIVPGSVEVHADGDYKELKTEAPGVVVNCDALDPDHHFKAGDVLLQLDDSEIRQQIADAKRAHDVALQEAEIRKKNDARLDLGKRMLDSAKRARERNDISDQDLDKAQREFNTLNMSIDIEDIERKNAEETYQSSMTTLNRALEKMTRKAPFDGVVNEVFAWKGALLSAGATVATIYSDARVVLAKVSEENIARVKPDQAAEVTLITYGTMEFPAKVTKILPNADTSQRYTVYLDVKTDAEHPLNPNATGEVRINIAEHPNVPLLPRTALSPGDIACVVRNGRVERRKVVVGFVGLTSVEAVSGVKAGEQVIVDAPDEFRNGQRVNAVSVDRPRS
jgi:HlyD family secretion protein